MNRVFVIRVDQDDIVRIYPLWETEFLRELKTRFWDDCHFAGENILEESFPITPRRWVKPSGSKAIVIRGELVVPRAKEKVISWELVPARETDSEE